ncbi:MAG: Ig-like domain-containing protein [Myxococcota bacterium]
MTPTTTAPLRHVALWTTILLGLGAAACEGPSGGAGFVPVGDGDGLALDGGGGDAATLPDDAVGPDAEEVAADVPGSEVDASAEDIASEDGAGEDVVGEDGAVGDDGQDSDGGGPDTVPPTVGFTSPAEGATVSGQVQVALEASDDHGVDRVEVFVDGAKATTLEAAPYEWTWDAAGVSPGAHALSAIAYDVAGNVGTAEVGVQVEETCVEGCGPTCGDGECTGDETGATCPEDCEAPPVCTPGEWTCEGSGARKQCNLDGSGFFEAVACPGGQTCSAGECVGGGGCEVDPALGAFAGCAFWTVDLPNHPDPTLDPTPEEQPHAVVVSNPGEEATTLAFEAPEGVTLDIADPTVPAGESRVFEMPVQNVSGTETAMKGIRLMSDRPVLAHQFNPWQNSFSNDASLLLPEALLGQEYVVLSWPTKALELTPIPLPGDPPNQSGWFTVVAPFDDTLVTVTVTANVDAGGTVQAMAPGDSQTVTLQAGEVLNVEADPKDAEEVADLTGSTVVADKPVAVFGGHEAAVVSPPGVDGCCADHLEEQLLPVEALGQDYLAVKTKPRGGDVDVWRVQAAEDDVTVTTDPAVEGLDGVTLAETGDWVEVFTDASFEVHGTGKLQVGQYLVGNSTTDSGVGDPSLVVGVPAERFRDSYMLMVPEGFDEHWLTVVKEAGTTVHVDGIPVAEVEFTPLGSGTWAYAWVALEPGVHDASGDAAFGLTAYGFGDTVSYAYPGGLSVPGL